jgi:hypothetical protein
MALIPTVHDGDWPALRRALQKLANKVGPDSAPTFSTITLTDLTASRVVASDANKALESVDLVDWVAGTANQITVTDDVDGSITLSLPQDYDTGATPTLGGLTIVNAITEFSTDGTMGGDSDSAVPTEKAVKAYVDGAAGGSLDHGLLAGLSDDDHTQYILHSLADAANDFLVASGADVFVKKTLAETGAILEGDIEHDNLQSIPANDHIDHTTVTLTAGTGLTGGGDISANRTFNVDVGIADDKILQVDDADAAGNDYARFTINGLEGRSYAEVLTDLSGQAGAAFDWNSQNLTNINFVTAEKVTVNNLVLDANTITVGTGDLILSSSDDDVDITAADDIVLTATDEINLTAGGMIEIRASGDTDDYIEIKTSNHVPEIDTSGNCDLKINSSSGEITSESNWTINGNLAATNIAAFTLTGKLTAGAVEIEGSAFDINGGTMDGVTIATDCTQTEWDSAYDNMVTAIAFNTGDGIITLTQQDTGTLTTVSLDGRYYTEAEIDAGYQPLDATLTSLAALGTAADKIAYTTGVDTWAETALTAFARTILDDADADTVRNTIELGTANTPQFESLGLGTGALATTKLNIIDKWDSGINALYGIFEAVTNDRGSADTNTTMALNFTCVYDPDSPTANRTTTTLAGCYGLCKAVSSDGTYTTTATNAYAFFGGIIAQKVGAAAGATIDTAYVYYAYPTTEQTGGVVNTAYAFYDAGQTAATTNWGIAINTANNYINGSLRIGSAAAPNERLTLDFATEDLDFVDAGSTGATEQDWIEVKCNGVQGYLHVFAAK